MRVMIPMASQRFIIELVDYSPARNSGIGAVDSYGPGGFETYEVVDLIS